MCGGRFDSIFLHNLTPIAGLQYFAKQTPTSWEIPDIRQPGCILIQLVCCIQPQAYTETMCCEWVIANDVIKLAMAGFEPGTSQSVLYRLSLDLLNFICARLEVWQGLANFA